MSKDEKKNKKNKKHSKKGKKMRDYSFTQNRELSWLKFDERVLEEADDNTVPLFERLNFISIFVSNLDEFYMIRCGSLYDLTLVKKNDIDNKSGMSPQEQLDHIYKETRRLYKRKDDIFNKVETKLIEKNNIKLLRFADLHEKETTYYNKYFFDYVFPVLSPQIIDPQHPFPHLVNNSLNIIIAMTSTDGKENKVYGIIPIPDSLPNVVFSPESSMRYMLIEDLIYEYANEIFSTYQIDFKTVVCVTRNADINLSTNKPDEDEDYRGYMKKILKKRNRLAPIRLEFYRYHDDDLEKFLIKKLNITKEQVFISQSPLKMTYVRDVYDKLEHVEPEIFDQISYPPYESKFNSLYKNNRLMDIVQHKDILLNYPYQSFDIFLKLLKEAANDENVLSIKMTIYRLANDSKVIKYLLEAIENGKNVTVLMELKARFDESHNIYYAELLENAGAKVIYGYEKYKVHSKICLIVRKDEDNKIHYITQLGTGNYNEKTCKIYTDYALLTANEEFGKDAVLFFKNLAISNLDGKYDHFLVAPTSLKQNLIKKIDRSIELANKNVPTTIIMKMNSLTDRQMIDKLHEASQAGVKIKMIIRGICCIVPGIPGSTDNIEVISIVGRFLEHSRIYCFRDPENTEIYLSSADLMTRNMNKRVEIAFPIYDPNIKQRILNDLNIYLQDNVKARYIDSNGNYSKVMRGVELLSAQDYFMEHADDDVHPEEVLSTSDKIKGFFNNLFRRNS
ncbi:polyphosphate kinase 1 [Methanobrevibacter boviskoreani]|uniref:polyphosphate kinase 1 n=1 Tax=Methanobrevibacter boviskoreani TaxID=1348249 RepID=UPI0023F2F504|nr:polyphosphate kinase 1 [Methanobrevibacter boviskoreani]MDD6256095.1 polyphosphate kinase 1 [Methanobrevibacter boviskoreani]